MDTAGPSSAAATSHIHVITLQLWRLRLLSEQSRRSQSFVAVDVFHRCKLLNGFLTPLRRRMKFGKSRRRTRCNTRKFTSFASLALLRRRIGKRGRVNIYVWHESMH
eukprot:164395-Pleurochrysis_carterae.AAC.1